jgi:hypothetical protein
MHKVERRWRSSARRPALPPAVLASALLALISSGSRTAQVPSTSPPQSPAAKSTPLDQPLQWMYEARKFHQSLGDYTCYMVSRERVRGVLQKENVIHFMFRPQPFSIYMKWLSPADLAGQEVAYIHGRNNNKMRVHPKKGGKIVGFMNVDPNDPRVFEHSRHNIYEAGIGNMIEQVIRAFEKERLIGKTHLTSAEYNYNNKRCYRIEATRTERNKDFYCYRTILYVDQETKLPIRMENYDWPTTGSPQGDLLEMFCYIDLRFNTGLKDGHFSR